MVQYSGLLCLDPRPAPKPLDCGLGCHVEAGLPRHSQSQFAGVPHPRSFQLCCVTIVGSSAMDIATGSGPPTKNSMLTGLLEVSFLSATVAFNREARLRCAKAQHMP